MSGIIITFFLVASIPLIIMQPVLGPVVYYWMVVMRPDVQMWGVFPIRWTLIIAIAALISMLIRAKQWQPPKGGLAPLLVIFAVWYYLSALVNTGSDMTLVTDFAKVVLMCMVTASVLITRVRLHAVIWVIVICVGAAAIRTAALLIVNPGSPFIIGPKVFGHTNEYARVLLYVFPLVLFLARYSAHKYVRLGMNVLAVCFVLSIIGTNSRGGFVALLAIGGVLWLRGKRKITTAIAALALIGGALLVIPESRIESITNRMSTIENTEVDVSFQNRTAVWAETWKYVNRNPIFGGGAGFAERVVERASHNSYMEVMGETGFVGLGIWTLILLGAISTSFRIRRLSKNILELRWAYDLAYFLQLSLVAYVVGGLVKNHGFFEYYYMLIGILLATETVVRTHIAAHAPDKEGRVEINLPKRIAPGRARA